MIGRNTVDQMHIGIYWGYVAMIEGLVARIKAEIGRPAKVIATGGLAACSRQHTEVFDVVEPDLTLARTGDAVGARPYTSSCDSSVRWRLVRQRHLHGSSPAFAGMTTRIYGILVTKPSNELLFVALGGSGEIGMNVNLYGCDGKWLMVDCGITFADPTIPAST